MIKNISHMSLFCDKCDNLLFINIENDKLTFICKSCNLIHKSNPEDTLIYEEINNEENLDKNSIIFNNIFVDPLNPKEKINCKKCNKKRNGIQIRLINSNNLKLYTFCEKCKEMQ